jgi:hypothetical protein
MAYDDEDTLDYISSPIAEWRHCIAQCWPGSFVVVVVSAYFVLISTILGPYRTGEML